MATVSDFEDREREDSGNGDGDDKIIGMSMRDRNPDLDATGDSVAGNPPPATNPRKRKKSSRA